MTIDTQKLRQCAIGSNDGLLRGPALAAADHIDAQAAEIQELKRRDAGANAALSEAAEVIRDRNDEIARLREALEWYASMSKQMGKAALNQDSQSILALMKEFAVDYGGRARAALSGEGK